jgi:hypothetical protein
MVTTKRNRALLKREPDCKKTCKSRPDSQRVPTVYTVCCYWAGPKPDKWIGLAMNQCRRKKSRHRCKSKDKKPHRNSFRKFLARNRDILLLLGVIFTALMLFFQIYLSPAQTKPETQPKPRFKIDQPARAVPVKLVNEKYLPCKSGQDF